jgi:hypothetical protein
VRIFVGPNFDRPLFAPPYVLLTGPPIHRVPVEEPAPLAAAPVLPVAGVATAFHRGLDPTYDVALASDTRETCLSRVRGNPHARF